MTQVSPRNYIKRACQLAGPSKEELILVEKVESRAGPNKHVSGHSERVAAAHQTCTCISLTDWRLTEGRGDSGRQ
ncbi:hypothetical protein O3P69_006294 [Scylla paramamosain]|uniref:Uncharacterized protein n=1 Tax=Scylla paramamosain TaxID=85552 RepID=A0AAW0U2L5_SCYPA